MKKILTLFLVFVVTFFASGYSCDNKNPNKFKPNKAELGEDWGQFKHDTSFNVWNFYGNRPTEHKTRLGARVFWNGTVTDEEKQIIENGLNKMFASCRLKFNTFWFNQPVWDSLYFNSIREYKIIFVTSNYTIQTGQAAGCAGIITGANGDCGGGAGTCSASGTVGGIIDRVDSTIPASKGGIYIIIPKQSPEQLARTECKSLMEDSIRNEGEHVVFTNVKEIHFAFANDGINGNHPYCELENTRILEVFRKLDVKILK